MGRDDSYRALGIFKPASFSVHVLGLILGLRPRDLTKTLQKAREPLSFKLILGAKGPGF